MNFIIFGMIKDTGLEIYWAQSPPEFLYTRFKNGTYYVRGDGVRP